MKVGGGITEELERIRKSVINTIPSSLLKYAASGALLGETDEEILEDVDLLVGNRVIAGAGVDYPALWAPRMEESTGDFMLGHIIVEGKPSHPFYLKENEILRHIAIFGGTGAGKTNLCINLLLELSKKQIPWMVLDWKRTYRDMLTIPRLRDTILVLTIGEPNPIRFNPLIPPEGTSPRVWLKKLIEIICTAYYLGEGVSYLLMKAIDMMYRNSGVYNGSSSYPTFHDVIRYVECLNLKGRSAQWKASTLRALANLTFGELGDVLCTDSNRSIRDLLKRNVIVELHKLTNADKKFLVSSLLLWLYFFRLNEGRRETLKHVLVLEEAHHISGSRFAEISGDESIVDVLIREVRELGEGIVIVTQTPSLLSKPVLGNTYCTVCMNLKERSDINLMGRILQIGSDQKRFLSKLEVGEAIVKLQSRFTDPFMIKVPLVEIRKGSVTDEDIKKYYAGFGEKNEIYVRFPETGGDYGGNKCQSEYSSKGPETSECLKSWEKTEGEVEISSFRGKEEISMNALKLLIDIASKPLMATTDRYEKLGMNRYQGNKARKELERLGLVKPVNLPSNGGYIRVYEITEKGEEILKIYGLTPKSLREGGILHQYFVTKLSEELRSRGLNVETEKRIGEGRTTDIVVNGRIAVEVEITKRDLNSDLVKNLGAGFEEVIFICRNPKSVKLAEGRKARIFGINEIDRAAEFILSLSGTNNPSLMETPLPPAPSSMIPKD